MKLTAKNMVEDQLKQIEYLQQQLQAADGAIQALYRLLGHGATVDGGNIITHLHRLELDAWRGLAMWGLTLDDAERDRIKAAVHQRFLHDRASVSQWMSGDGTSPSQWLVADEEEFREMAKTAFAPRP